MLDFYPFPRGLKNLVHFSTLAIWGHFELKEYDLWPSKKWVTVEEKTSRFINTEAFSLSALTSVFNRR